MITEPAQNRAFMTGERANSVMTASVVAEICAPVG